MRCSSCSRSVKPLVALDIDGTMGDYHGHFLRFAANYVTEDPTEVLLRMSLRKYDGSMSFRSYCCQMMGISDTTFRAIKLAFRQGGMKRTMPMYFGAYALATSIRDAGAELWITTTRPYLSMDTVMTDTIEWMRRHGIKYDGMLFDDDKYAKLAEQIEAERVVAIFDDIDELVSAANRYFPGRGWLVRGEYNQGTRARLMCTLDSAADLAVQAINEWKQVYSA